MDKIIVTPRLKLVRLDELSDGSIELEHAHIVRSSQDATLWNLAGASKTIADTQQNFKIYTDSSSPPDDTNRKHFRMYYIVYTRDLNDSGAAPQRHEASNILGAVFLKEPQLYGIPLSDQLTLPESVAAAHKVLKSEVGYGFLRAAWGKGYASEALGAFVAAFQKARALWHPPYERIYLEAVVGPNHRPSQRVLEKAGFRRVGIHEWEGPHVFIGGGMHPPRIFIYGYGPFPELERKD